jgi:predicted RNase H-like HicB family nuclease
MKLQYAVVFERTPNNYCAYVPDLPGCISTGKSWTEMKNMIQEAITGHIEVMLEYGDPLPEKAMSLDDAIAHHCQVIVDCRAECPADIDGPPSLSTTFEMIEVYVEAPSPIPGN